MCIELTRLLGNLEYLTQIEWGTLPFLAIYGGAFSSFMPLVAKLHIQCLEMPCSEGEEAESPATDLSS